MSDETPVDAAPETAQPAAEGDAKAPAQTQDELDALLAAKPVTFKAGGKEVTFKSRAELTRRLQNAFGVENKNSELSKTAAEAQALREQVQRIREARPEDQVQMLAEMLGGEDRVRAAAEALARRELQKQQERSKVPPEMQPYLDRLEQLEREKNELEAKEQERAEALKQQERQQRLQQVRESVALPLAKALEAAKLKPEHAAMLERPVIAALQVAKAKGYDLNEQEVSEVVLEAREEMVFEHLAAHPPEALVDKLEAKGLLKPLTAEIAKRVRAKIGAAPGAPQVRQPTQTQPAAPRNGAERPSPFQGRSRPQILGD